MIMNKKRTITIVGAGLTGSLLGVLLGQRGYVVELFERRQRQSESNEDSGRSINLALSRRGIDALKLAGLMDDVRPLLIPMPGRMLHLENGRSEFSPYGQQESEVIYSVSRQELNQLLVDKAVAAPKVEVTFGLQCRSIDFENKTIQFEREQSLRQPSSGDDRSAEVSQSSDTGVSVLTNHLFDMLIGTDGAGSQVRRNLIQFTGGQSNSDFLDHDYKELEIPAGENGAFRLEKNALHIWPRGNFMLIALPNLDGSFTVTLFLPKQGSPSFQSLNSKAAVRTFFDGVFPTAAAVMPDLIKDFFDHPAGRLGTVRCRPWHAGDCGLILGDAAHAIVPFHGQGMNAAFEDCSELMRLLDAHGDDWATVNRKFSEIRKPNADAIAEMALENYKTMRLSVADPKYALKKAIGFELERRFGRRFIPRYSMVMFHAMPYAEALAQGLRQQEILDRLTQSVDSIDAVDWTWAEALVDGTSSAF
jgi:kynurenine 3-monooxygenase